MVRFPIRFQSISDVKEFVQIVNSFPYDVDLSSGRYVVDESAINLEIHSNTCDDLVDALTPFRVEE